MDWGGGETGGAGGCWWWWVVGGVGFLCEAAAVERGSSYKSELNETTISILVSAEEEASS